MSWVSRSSLGGQLAAAIVSASAGGALMIGCRGFRDAGENAIAGFWLGVLLFGLGVAALAFSGRQTVTVDPRARSILVEDTYLIGAKSRSIRFADVSSVTLGYLGKRSNYLGNYYLVLHLSDGTEYSLFAPGRFYSGASDRSIVDGWRRRLETYLSQDAGTESRQTNT